MLNNRLYSQAFLMWFITLSFFGYQFILRLWPSLLMEDIMKQFNINATSFGILASLYYYGYAGFQIPLAILLERVNVKYIISFCALLCGLATYICANTSSWHVALVARFLIGVGSAAGFLGVSKIVSEWFPKEKYSQIIGLSFSIGLIGAIYGGKPVGLLINKIGKIEVVNLLSITAFIIAAATLVLLKNSPNGVVNSPASKLQIKDLKKILSSRVILLLAFANLLMVGSLEGFADVWGTNYLMITYKIAKPEAAGIISFIFVGMLFGGPLLAYLANKAGSLTVISCCGLGLCLLLIIVIFQEDNFNKFGLISLFTCIGILCCYQVIVFAAGSEYVDKHSLGITIAFLNSINMLGGSFFHSIIGLIMDYYWDGQLLDNYKIYSVSTYRVALSIIPFCAILGALIVWNIKIYIKKNKILL